MATAVHQSIKLHETIRPRRASPPRRAACNSAAARSLNESGDHIKTIKLHETIRPRRASPPRRAACNSAAAPSLNESGDHIKVDPNLDLDSVVLTVVLPTTLPVLSGHILSRLLYSDRDSFCPRQHATFQLVCREWCSVERAEWPHHFPTPRSGFMWYQSLGHLKRDSSLLLSGLRDHQTSSKCSTILLVSAGLLTVTTLVGLMLLAASVDGLMELQPSELAASFLFSAIALPAGSLWNVAATYRIWGRQQTEVRYLKDWSRKLEAMCCEMSPETVQQVAQWRCVEPKGVPTQLSPASIQMMKAVSQKSIQMMKAVSQKSIQMMKAVSQASIQKMKAGEWHQRQVVSLLKLVRSEADPTGALHTEDCCGEPGHPPRSGRFVSLQFALPRPLLLLSASAALVGVTAALLAMKVVSTTAGMVPAEVAVLVLAAIPLEPPPPGSYNYVDMRLFLVVLLTLILVVAFLVLLSLSADGVIPNELGCCVAVFSPVWILSLLYSVLPAIYFMIVAKGCDGRRCYLLSNAPGHTFCYLVSFVVCTIGFNFALVGFMLTLSGLSVMPLLSLAGICIFSLVVGMVTAPLTLKALWYNDD